MVLHLWHADSSLKGALLDQLGLGVDVADKAGGHDHMECRVNDPHDQVDGDQEGGVVSKLACDRGETTGRCRERQLKDGENPGKGESDDAAPPADLADPPAEDAGVSAGVEEPGNEFDDGGHSVDEEGGEVGGGSPSVLSVHEHGPEPTDRHRVGVVVVDQICRVLDVNEPLEDPPSRAEGGRNEERKPRGGVFLSGNGVQGACIGRLIHRIVHENTLRDDRHPIVI